MQFITFIFSQRILLLSFLLFTPFLLNAQNDTIVMRTGEYLVGEIKGFDESIVRIETDYSDNDFSVEWDKLVSIHTIHKFVIISTDGKRYYGSLNSDSSDSRRVLIMDDDEGEVVLPLNKIVFFKKVEDSFGSRFDLKLSAGYDLTKANNNHQFSANFTAGYLSSIYRGDVHFGIIRSIQTTDEIVSEVRRTEAGLGFTIMIINDWFGVARADLLQSSEQKLDLRNITKAGVGNYILANNKMNLGFAGGMAWNYENFTDPTLSDKNSAELFAAAEYRIFNLGDLELNTKVAAYPGLTEGGRFRSDFKFSIEYEFEFDLFINLSFTVNYDNQPTAGADPTDYVLSTSIGWEL